MKITEILTKEILDFEKECPTEMLVKERRDKTLPKYYVSFENSEVSVGGCLIGAHGNGNTIDEAIQDYCKEIEKTRLVFFSYTPNRKEIDCPKLVHTKLLNK